MTSTVPKIYRITVTLQHVDPSVWRRIEVPADITLGKLHRVLQAAMGWTDRHLHAFRADAVIYGLPHPEFADDTRDERNVRLDGIAGEGDMLLYEYDFGDGWVHTLSIDQSAPPDPAVHYPRCSGGERACPPEDCGGPPGYEQLLQALRDPENPEHRDILEWLGGDFDPQAFDPQAFDLGAVNRALWRLK